MNYCKALQQCSDHQLTAKARYLKLLQNHYFTIPLTYYLPHESIKNILSPIPNFDYQLRMCALTADNTLLRKMREHVLSLPLNRHLSQDFNNIISNHEDIKQWIVRSAFGAEDAKENSLAGNFLSCRIEHLSAKSIFENFKEVLASFFEQAAFEHMLASGINPVHCRFGMLVQEYVQGITSGVGFSRDPNNLIHFAEHPHELNGYVESVEGDCALLTSGESSLPFSPRGGGIKGEGLISHHEIFKAEELLKSPIDFEWTFDGEKLWWLQVRPVATESSTWAIQVRQGARFTRESIAERFPDILTPMGWSLVKGTMENSLKSFGTYIGIEFRNTAKASFFYKGLVYANKKYYTLKNCRPTFRSCLLLLLFFCAPLRGLRRITCAVLEDWHIILAHNILATYAFDCSIKNEQDFTQKMIALRNLGKEFFKTDVATHFLREAYGSLLSKALVGYGMDEIQARTLCAEFGENITMNMQRDLQAMRNAPHKDPLIASFLAKHGHMTMGWDIAQPTLRENEAAIATLLLNTDAKANAFHDEKTFAERNFGKNINAALKLVQALACADEQQHYYAGLHLSKARELLKNLAKLWVEKQVLNDEDDIFYLSVDELERYLANPECSLKLLAQRRKRTWQRYKESCDNSQIAVAEGTTLQGVAASSGCATGAVYIANGWDDLARMPNDAVLCLKTPNPSYVPWFDRCKAVVTENGAVLSHGFIAARELHVPAVTGIPLDMMSGSKFVTVDGDSGKIVLHTTQNFPF